LQLRLQQARNERQEQRELQGDRQTLLLPPGCFDLCGGASAEKNEKTRPVLLDLEQANAETV
jgi:hypothetical protein